MIRFHAKPRLIEEESSAVLLTLELCQSKSVRMKMSRKGQVTIPLTMRRKHGLLPRQDVKFVDQPNGVLVAKADKLSGGQKVVAALLRGGKVKGNTESWLRLTRGAA